MASKSVIITAGGVGKRMGSEIPKQFLVIGNKPIILHTIERFLKYDSAIELILVLPEEYVHIWEEICQKYLFIKEHKVALGGAERFHSIQSGLALATGDLIAVHDAVRPLVSIEVITSCFDAAEKNGAAIPVFSISESVRKIEHDKSFAVNRDDYKLVQTPQCFQASILRHAYQQHYSHLFTDDASVVEADGVKITLVSGNRENIKITTPHDLKLAELFFEIVMTTDQPNNPTHGVTLEMMLTHLVNIYGWDELSDMTKIKAFAVNPSIKSGLNFIRKTPWGKKKIEDLYRDSLKK